MTLSGKSWVSRFPTSRSFDDLEDAFKYKALRFVEALREAGAQVRVAATYRPPQRAYLMHYAVQIAKTGHLPGAVPDMYGVDIQWDHGDPVASRSAAQEMVDAYGVVFAPALVSRHTQGLAIDMAIEWMHDMKVRTAAGLVQSVPGPRNGAQNTALHDIGATYGVIKLVSDPPHWSSDGH